MIERITKRALEHGNRLATSQRLAVTLSLSLVVLAVVAALVLMQGIDRQIFDMNRTYEVRNQARELTLALTEAEASQQRYMLLQDPRYLEAYRRAEAAIDTRISSLSALAVGDPARAAQTQAIVSDITARSGTMAQVIELLTSGRIAEAEALAREADSGRMMDPVRMALERFINEESQNLLDRNWSIKSTRRWLVGTIIVALAGAVVLAYVLFIRAQREVRVLARNRSLLLDEKEVLEAHVRERTQAVEEARAHAERERQRVEALLQDTSHRIGNSLATVSSLLGLQLMRSKSEEVRQALEAARSRVHAIASAHRRLRLGDDLEQTDADEFLEAVLQDLSVTVSETRGVTLSGQFDSIVIGARDATTIGILVSELVTNALKHAFPADHGGNIIVQLKRDEEGLPILCVCDDGVGMDADSQQTENGLGSVIVKQLAAQFGGTPIYRPAAQGGLQVVIPLPGIESQNLTA